MSDKGLDDGDCQELVRVYWNLTATGAVTFIRTATRVLNGADAYFRLKVVNDAARFERCDAAVLYMRKSDYGAARELLRRIYSDVVCVLKPETPALTKPLAPGVGFAEDPGRGNSFGLHRCCLLADGMPLTRRAKLLMATQSVVSFATIVVVGARAVNILK